MHGPYTKIFNLLQLMMAQKKPFPFVLEDLQETIVGWTFVSEIQFYEVPAKNENLGEDIDSNLRLVSYPPPLANGTAGLPRIVADIYIGDHLCPIEMRWASFKECCQIIWADLPDTYSVSDPDLQVLLHGLLFERSTGGAPTSPPLLSEQFARLCALELLFPFGERLRWYDAFKNNQVTAQELSGMFAVPERIVRHLMDLHDVYVRIWGPLYRLKP